MTFLPEAAATELAAWLLISAFAFAFLIGACA
jgi:hypothetical protein